MARLILSMDGLVLKEIALDKERLTIGRRPSNDVQIDNLAISGHHAVITTLAEDAFLEDLNSTNGTCVNGDPVKRRLLKPNDVIELGKYRLKYVVDHRPGSGPTLAHIDAVGLTPAAAARPAPARPAPPRPAAAAVRADAPAANAPERVGVIQVLSGAHVGRELVLNKALTTLGRPGQQVAVITRRQHGFFITHVEGVALPRVNGVPIGAQAHMLNEHDLIEMAGVKMEFFLRSDSVPGG